MIQIRADRRKVVASLLTFCFLMHQTLCLQVLASNISGIDGKPNAGGSGNVFDIDPSAINGNIGFRKYHDFVLSEGDIANLIFKYGAANVEKFVNLVDNTINIQGIVNSMRDGSFYDGHAVFISPNGMVVGASGVINVGSLSVITPTQESFDKMKGDIDTKPYIIQNYEKALTPGNGTVTIDGKVIARNLVDIKAADVNLNANGSIMSGVKDATTLNSLQQAESLFNNLVNTDNLTPGNSFANEHGNIIIKSYGENGGTQIAGDIKNFGAGNIDIINSGSKGIEVTGKISNAKGNTTFTNENGALNIASSVANRGGDLTLNNSGSGVLIPSKGALSNKGGNTNITNTGKNGLIIDGSVSNVDGNVVLDNSGDKGLIVNGSIDNQNGDINAVNSGSQGLKINGAINNKNGSSVYTNKKGQLVVNGNVNNEGKFFAFHNTGSGIIVGENALIKGDGEFEMTNTGSAGTLINGVVANRNGNALISNNAGKLDINGTVSNVGPQLSVINNGTGMTVSNTGKIRNNGKLLVINTGSEGMNIAGSVDNTGNAEIVNSGKGALVVNGTVTNNGNMNVNNSGEKGLLVNGSISNKNGDLSVLNSGTNGMIINGKSSNENGNSSYRNEKGELLVNGTVSNNGPKMAITNVGSGLKISSTGKVENVGELSMVNSGINRFSC